jgi:hypothetical protein
MQNYMKKTVGLITGCSSTNKLYCWPCLLFNKEKIVWNSAGYSDLNNLRNAKKRHVCSEGHRKSIEECHNFGKGKIEDVIDDFAKRKKELHNSKVEQNRRMLKRLIDTVLFLANQDLAFRGHNKKKKSLNQGNYVELLNLLSRYDSELSEQLKKDDKKWIIHHQQYKMT